MQCPSAHIRRCNPPGQTCGGTARRNGAAATLAAPSNKVVPIYMVYPNLRFVQSPKKSNASARRGIYYIRLMPDAKPMRRLLLIIALVLTNCGGENKPTAAPVATEVADAEQGAANAAADNSDARVLLPFIPIRPRPPMRGNRRRSKWPPTRTPYPPLRAQTAP